MDPSARFNRKAVKDGRLRVAARSKGHWISDRSKKNNAKGSRTLCHALTAWQWRRKASRRCSVWRPKTSLSERSKRRMPRAAASSQEQPPARRKGFLPSSSWKVFSDALPLLQAGVGGYTQNISKYTYSIQFSKQNVHKYQYIYIYIYLFIYLFIHSFILYIYIHIYIYIHM